MAEALVHVLQVAGSLPAGGGQFLLRLPGCALGLGQVAFGVSNTALSVHERPLGGLDLPGRGDRGFRFCGCRAECRLDGVTDTGGAQLDRTERGSQGENTRGGDGRQRAKLGNRRPEGRNLRQGKNRRRGQRPDAAGKSAEAAAAAARGPQGRERASECGQPDSADVDVGYPVAGEGGEGGGCAGDVGAGGDACGAAAGEVVDVVCGDPGVDVDADADPLALGEAAEFVGGDPGVEGGPDLDEAVGGELVEGLLDAFVRRVVDFRDDVGGGLAEPGEFRLGGGVVDLSCDLYGAVGVQLSERRLRCRVVQLGGDLDGALVCEPAQPCAGCGVVELGPDLHRAVAGEPGQGRGGGLVVQLGRHLDGAGFGQLGELRFCHRGDEVDTNPHRRRGRGELPPDSVKDLVSGNLPGELGGLADRGGQLDTEPVAELGRVRDDGHPGGSGECRLGHAALPSYGAVVSSSRSLLAQWSISA
ncbi:hypothetical protein GA0115253_102141 [Streptomyces sp. Termitarium-T10T-6]|nr:hypothetical protein GA0115253_102141 [Streptomyces sp. Termitarium-T10T-6]